MRMCSIPASPRLLLAGPWACRFRAAFDSNTAGLSLVVSRRPLSLSSQRMHNPEPSAAAGSQQVPLSPRWIADIRQRIGKCITFGLNAQQVQTTGRILGTVAREWRDLSAGSEGFLTGPGRAGLVNQRVVWGEMDRMGHVNNVTYVRYAESARIEWLNNFAAHIDPAHRREWSELHTPKGNGLILRSMRTEYKFPMTWPDHVSVFHKLRDPPHPTAHSFILDVLILSERAQRPAARCIEDHVIYDYQQGKKTVLPSFMARQFDDTFRLQEAARKENVTRVERLLQRVRDLELESWDRSDAKEDFGSAT